MTLSRRDFLRSSALLLAPMTSANAASAPQRRAIPRAQETLPCVGVGTWQTFDVGSAPSERTELREVIRLLPELGGSVIDSSPMYGAAEAVVGDLVTDVGNRDRLFFATKVWTSGREVGIRQMENSFRLMRTTRMDLMQIHNLVDTAVHTRTINEWKQAGRVRYIGITHYHSGAYRELEQLVRTKQYDFVQFNYSMMEREADDRLLSACADSATAVLINRPFAQGGLFPKVKGKPLPPWAAEFECTSWAQFFLKWILGHPAVTCVIPGVSRVTHLRENLQAGATALPDAAMRRRMLDHLRSL